MSQRFQHIISNLFVNLNARHSPSFMKHSLIQKITDNSLIFLSVMAVPLNIILYIVFKERGQNFEIFVTPFLSLFVFGFTFFRSRIPLHIKVKVLNIIFLSGGVFAVLMGLLDLGSLWFMLSIIYTLFILKRRAALFIFSSALGFMMIAGYMLVTQSGFIPLGAVVFENCYYPCVVTRILHFIIVGFLIYYIVSSFLKEINENMMILNQQAEDLKNINENLKKESEAKQKIQAELIDAIILTEERERKRIARDLHDGLGPVLSSVHLYYQAYIDAKTEEEKANIEVKLKQNIKNAMQDVSKISHNISPEIIENNGLIVGLNNFINEIGVKKDLEISLEHDAIERFDIKKELSLYRAVTELINNTIKHAKASLIHIQITVGDANIIVNYCDNGQGIDQTKLGQSTGIGLKNIANRMQSLGGSFVFVSKDRKAFRARLILPL